MCGRGEGVNWCGYVGESRRSVPVLTITACDLWPHASKCRLGWLSLDLCVCVGRGGGGGGLICG